MLTNLISISLGAILVENFIFSKFLGICPFMGVSKKTDTAAGMGFAVIFVMALSSIISYLINLILIPLGLEYMQTLSYILVIAALVKFVEMFLRKMIPSLYEALGIYLPLITTNCAVLGVTINNITDGYNFLESMVSSLGVGLGFLLAMVLFAGVRSKIDNSAPPKCLQGLPVTLIAASIVSLSFYGFASVVENLLK